MNPQNIYEGLTVEPAEPVPAIRLTARTTDSTHFVFIPETWEAALKPYRKASWKHEKGHEGSGFVPYRYELRRGNYVVFYQLALNAGFYIARLYAVVKEMEQGEQAYGEVFENRLEITQNRQRVTLKTNPMGGLDGLYHAILSY